MEITLLYYMYIKDIHNENGKDNNDENETERESINNSAEHALGIATNGKD